MVKYIDILIKLWLALNHTDIDDNVSFVQIELLDTVALNLHRIDKDVQRCDRNYYYFTTANLEKLRNIMCRYVEEVLRSYYIAVFNIFIWTMNPWRVILKISFVVTNAQRIITQQFPSALWSFLASFSSLFWFYSLQLYSSGLTLTAPIIVIFSRQLFSARKAQRVSN